MSLIIGVDADGVLTNLYDFNKRCGEKLFKKEIINKEGYSAREMFDLTKKQEILFVLRYIEGYCKSEIPKEGCVEALQYFDKKGYELHSITARIFATRQHIGKRYQTLFKNWLVKNEISLFKTIQFCSEKETNRDKFVACNKLNVDVMIDDSPEVTMHLANKGIKVALIDAPYNQNVSHENIQRCKNYEDVKAFVDSIYEQKSNEKLQSEVNQQYNLLKTQPFDKNELKNNAEIFNRNYKSMMKSTKQSASTTIKDEINIIYQDGMVILSNYTGSSDKFAISYALRNRFITIYEDLTGEKSHAEKLMDKSNCIEPNVICEAKLGTKLVNGQTLVIFPKTNEIKFETKIFEAVKNSKVPILPVAIKKDGDNDKKSTVIFGKSFFVTENDDLDKIKNECEKIIQNLIDNA